MKSGHQFIIHWCKVRCCRILTTTRRLAKDVYGGMLATEPCLNQPPVVPFAFDRVKGLPPRCVDALGLCVGALTSTVDITKLLHLGLIPVPQNHLGLGDVTCGQRGKYV